jgi:hypothetical protein
MKTKNTLLPLTFAALLALAGCTSDQMGASDNPHPRRTYNTETGQYEGPTPMPPPNGSSSGNH